jgi:hypothetical protein
MSVKALNLTMAVKKHGKTKVIVGDNDRLFVIAVG